MRRENEERQKHAEEYNHFPFVGGEIIEKHRDILGKQMKNELQCYLNAKNIQNFSRTGNSFANSNQPPSTIDGRKTPNCISRTSEVA